MVEISWPIKSRRFTPCAAIRTRLSNGCKFRLLPTTPVRSVFCLIHYCATCAPTHATRLWLQNSVCLKRHERETFVFRRAQTTQRHSFRRTVSGRRMAAHPGREHGAADVRRARLVTAQHRDFAHDR